MSPVTEKQWSAEGLRYRNYIRLEKQLSGNTVASYMRDFAALSEFMSEKDISPSKVTAANVDEFMASQYDKNIGKTTQARRLSGVRSFFNYLLLDDRINASPVEFIENPKIGRQLPDVLATADIDRMIATFDTSTELGVRNTAMLEMLYSCGLRVSELVGLRLGDLFFDDGFIRVIGKGDRQRLVPISTAARKKLSSWLAVRDRSMGAEEIFLNIRGRRLTREMVFHIIKEASLLAGIGKPVSPHTLRHSFATHLLEGGASIRQVQQLLGHESVTTTEIYTHLDTAHLRQTIDTHHPLSQKM